MQVSKKLAVQFIRKIQMYAVLNNFIQILDTFTKFLHKFIFYLYFNVIY